MARRITGGLVGSSTLLGTIQISPEAAMSTATDQDITFSPGAGGQVVSTANFQLNAQTDLRFGDADSSNWVAFQGPATVSSNVTWTLPATDGAAPAAGISNQVLSSNGSGTLSWITPNVSVVDQTISATTHYVTLTTATTNSTITTLNRSSTKLTFQPSTGTLTATILAGGGGGITSLGTTRGYQIGSLGVGTAASATTGEIRATNEITAFFSDQRLKENITVIENALEKVSTLSGVTYNSNELASSFGFNKKDKMVGVLAQDVEQVLPEAVCLAPFDIEVNEDGSETSKSKEFYKTVKYEKLVPLLVEAIKELKLQINDIKKSLE